MPSPATDLLHAILSAQNSDGGWGYLFKGQSWTEPTIYALLALRDAGAGGEAVGRGERWITRTQRPDGGWSPRPSVDESTWVTALVLLLRAGESNSPSLDRAMEWLLAQMGRESTFLQRLRERLLGVKAERDANSRGWPWFPNTAAWVVPTALSILALLRLERREPQAECRERIEMGRRFLLDKRCQDGGWNHGSSRALGYEASSYPETTGLVLLALCGVPPERLARSFAAAERHLRNCRSAEALSWLRLGLMAHSRLAAGVSFPPVACRTVMEAALLLLADRAAAGRNIFLE